MIASGIIFLLFEELPLIFLFGVSIVFLFVNSLSLVESWLKAYLFALFKKDFSLCRILAWQLFSFITLNMSCHCLMSMFSVESQPSVISLLLSLPFSRYTVTYRGMVFFVFILLMIRGASWICGMSFVALRNILAIIFPKMNSA